MERAPLLASRGGLGRRNAKTTRDILQLALLGSGPQFGTGMIPADLILDTTPKSGVPEGVETIYVRHISGGRSELQLKSFNSALHPYAPFKNFTPYFHIPSISLTFAMRPDTKMEGAFFTSGAYGTAI